MKTTIKHKKQAIFILLIMSFIMSQDLPWLVLRILSPNLRLGEDHINSIAFSVSASAALLFCLFSVAASRDAERVQIFLNNHPETKRLAVRIAEAIYIRYISLLYYAADKSLKMDNSTKIEEEKNMYMQQSNILKIVFCIFIVSVACGFGLWLLFMICPGTAEFISSLLKLSANVFLFCFLWIGVREKIEETTGQ